MNVLTSNAFGRILKVFGVLCLAVLFPVAASAMAIEKTAIGTPWQAGGTGSYQINVTNTGGPIAPGTIIVVQDNGSFPSPPLNLAGIAGDPGWDCISVPGQCSYTVGSTPVPSGTSWSFTVNVGIDASYAGGMVQNCAELTLQQAGAVVVQQGCGCASALIQPVQSSSGITKTAIGPFPWQTGGTGTFEISSTSPWALSGLPMIVKDIIPSPPFSLSATQPNNAPWICNDWGNPLFNYGALYPPFPGSPPPPSNWLICILDSSASPYPINIGDALPPILVNVDIDPNYSGGTVKNCAEIGHFTPAAPVWYNQPGCVEVPVDSQSSQTSLTINKTALGTPWQAGGTGSYNIVVTNTGGVISGGTLVVHDGGNFPSPPLTMTSITSGSDWDCISIAGQCSYIGSYPIAAGASWTFTVNVGIDAGYSGGTVKNCAELTLQEAGPPQLLGNSCVLADITTSNLIACTSTAECDDGNSCTVDSCSASGVCISTPTNGVPCDDGNVCTASDTCSNQTCIGTPVMCDDGNASTIDFCSGPQVGCIFTPVTPIPLVNASLTVQMKYSPRTFSTGTKAALRLKVKNKGNKLGKGMLTVVNHLPAGLAVKTGDFRANSWRCKGGMISSSGQDVTCTYNRKLGKKSRTTLTLNVAVASADSFPADVKEVENCATASVVEGVANTGGRLAASNGNMAVKVCDKVKIRHIKSRGSFSLPIGIGIGFGGIGGGTPGRGGVAK